MTILEEIFSATMNINVLMYLFFPVSFWFFLTFNNGITFNESSKSHDKSSKSDLTVTN